MFTAGNDLVGDRGFCQYPPVKKLRYCNTLTWPQNGGYPISEDVDFDIFLRR